MKHVILLLTLSVSTVVVAQEKPILTNYNCTSEGCSLTCLNIKNNWSTVSGKANKVTVRHYSNGNIEFALNHINSKENITQGNEVIYISELRLKCKLSGISPH